MIGVRKGVSGISLVGACNGVSGISLIGVCNRVSGASLIGARSGVSGISTVNESGILNLILNLNFLYIFYEKLSGFIIYSIGLVI